MIKRKQLRSYDPFVLDLSGETYLVNDKFVVYATENRCSDEIELIVEYGSNYNERIIYRIDSMEFSKKLIKQLNKIFKAKNF